MLYFASSLLLPYLMLQHNSDRMDYSHHTKLIACHYRLQGYSYHQRERNYPSTNTYIAINKTRARNRESNKVVQELDQ